MLSHRHLKRAAMPLIAILAWAGLAVAPALAQETTGHTTVWIPEDASTTGAAIDLLFNFILYLTSAVGIAVFVVLIIFLVKYRHQPGRHAKFIHGNNKLETVWTLIPTLILALIAVFSQSTWSQVKSYDNMPNPATDPDVVHVEVIGRQFKWYYHYPGADGKMGPRKWAKIDPLSSNPEELIGLHRGENLLIEQEDGTRVELWGEVTEENDDTLTLATYEYDNAVKDWVEVSRTLDAASVVARNEYGKDDLVTSVMYIPVNRKVYMEISSVDVIHSFWLPNFRVKQDAMPGLNARAWLEATKTSAQVIGTDEQGNPKPFEIVCAELCGQGHYTMKGLMYVVSDADYQAFLDEQALYLPGDDDW